MAKNNQPKGLAKIGLPRTPTSSGLPQRTVYTGGRAERLSKQIYGTSPHTTVTPEANKLGGSRDTCVIGKKY